MRWLIQNVPFDMISHEHYCYFFGTALRPSCGLTGW